MLIWEGPSPLTRNLRLTGMENPRGALGAILQKVGAGGVQKEARLFSADCLAIETLLQGLCWGLCFEHAHLSKGWLFWPMMQVLLWI